MILIIKRRIILIEAYYIIAFRRSDKIRYRTGHKSTCLGDQRHLHVYLHVYLVPLETGGVKLNNN